MKIGRRRREEAEVESSAMNDIMFFLMLFFLIASTLANPNVINITLPKANHHYGSYQNIANYGKGGGQGNGKRKG